MGQLRRGHVLAALQAQVRRLRDAAGAFRVVHYSLQHNHLHLLCEAGGKAALARGINGFASALARAINQLSGRAGRLWASRYHAHILRSPREVRHALVYVLRNGLKHGVARGEDSFSSAAAFDGFAERNATDERVPVARARTWLLNIGWRRRGLIRAHERPKLPARGVVIWDYLQEPTTA